MSSLDEESDYYDTYGHMDANNPKKKNRGKTKSNNHNDSES